MSLGCNEHSLETLILVQMTFLMYRFIEFPEPLLRYVVLLSGVITFFFIISVRRRWNGGGPIRLLLLNYQVGVRLIFTFYIYRNNILS